MSLRKLIRLVRPHERRRLGRWLVWCLLIAGAINVPFAVTRVEQINSGSPMGSTLRDKDDIPAEWPIATPHAVPWPAPTYWEEWTGFGKWFFHVSMSNPESRKNRFTLILRRSGWPMPVLEQRQMWWDWDDPALQDVKGIESDPPMRLMPAGLIINPIVVGGGWWVLMVVGFFLTVIRRRAKRLRRGLCLECGYDLAGLEVGTESEPAICPECGVVRSRSGENPA